MLVPILMIFLRFSCFRVTSPYETRTDRLTDGRRTPYGVMRLIGRPHNNMSGIILVTAKGYILIRRRVEYIARLANLLCDRYRLVNAGSYCLLLFSYTGRFRAELYPLGAHHIN